MLNYFKVEGVEGDYFACARYGTLSTSSCARNFKEAPAAFQKSGRLAACVGCPIGGTHASGGQVAEADVAQRIPVKTADAMVYRSFCVRCRRTGSDDNHRLIGRMRLVRNKTLCMSCYNREREVLHDRNAKGAQPKKWRSLFMIRIAHGSGASSQVEQFSQPVHDYLEAGLTVLRRESGPQFLGWTACTEMWRFL